MFSFLPFVRRSKCNALKAELEQVKRERDACHRKMEIAQAKVSVMREGFEILWNFADWWTEEEWEARLAEKEGPQDQNSEHETFKVHFQRVLKCHLLPPNYETGELSYEPLPLDRREVLPDGSIRSHKVIRFAEGRGKSALMYQAMNRYHGSTYVTDGKSSLWKESNQ